MIYLKSFLAGIAAVLIAGIAAPFLLSAYASLKAGSDSSTYYYAIHARQFLIFLSLGIFILGFVWEFCRERLKK